MADAGHMTKANIILSFVYSTAHLYIYIATALTPDPVRSLIAALDTHKPSVTLSWDPPANAAHAGCVTKYEIHFQDNDSSFHGEKAVDGSTTTTVITRESGLRPLTTFTFKVRAYSGDNASKEWRTVSRFIGMYAGL